MKLLTLHNFFWHGCTASLQSFNSQNATLVLHPGRQAGDITGKHLGLDVLAGTTDVDNGRQHLRRQQFLDNHASAHRHDC